VRVVLRQALVAQKDLKLVPVIIHSYDFRLIDNFIRRKQTVT